MGLIKEYFNRIIKKQKEIGYSMTEFLNPGIDKLSIDLFENKYSIELNEEFKEYLAICDGMNILGIENGNKCSILPDNYYLASTSNISDYLNTKLFVTLIEYFELTQISALHIPILIDSIPKAYWVNIDKNDQYYGYILSTSSLNSMPEYSFYSMEKLFETICMAYESNLIYIENINQTICMDSVKFEQLKNKMNARIEI